MRTLKSAIVCALMLTVATPVLAQSLSGLQIGDNIAAAERQIRIPPIAKEQSGPFVIEKWALLDGNGLSVTSVRQTGRIIYMESDWHGGQSGSVSDFPGMIFGRTTLREVLNLFGSYGFGYASRGVVRLPDGTAIFNCYQVASTANTVAVFVSKASAADVARTTTQTVANVTMLQAIIVADVRYLDSIWGQAKTYDPTYRSIIWPTM